MFFFASFACPVSPPTPFLFRFCLFWFPTHSHTLQPGTTHTHARAHTILLTQHKTHAHNGFFVFHFFSCCKTNRTRCERRAQQNKHRACGWVGSKENKDVFAQGVGGKGGGGRKRKKNTTAATPPHPPKTLSLFLMRLGGKRVCARVCVRSTQYKQTPANKPGGGDGGEAKRGGEGVGGGG